MLARVYNEINEVDVGFELKKLSAGFVWKSLEDGAFIGSLYDSRKEAAEALQQIFANSNGTSVVFQNHLCAA